MNFKLLFVFSTLVLGISLQGAPAEKRLSGPFNPAAVAYPRFDGDHYIEGGWLNHFEEECRSASKADSCKVAFIGDSITEQWLVRGLKVWQELASWNPENYGISGDRTESVLWRLEKGLLQPELRPELFVVMIGTNNYGSPRKDTPEQVAQGIEKIVKILRVERPESKILLYAVFPRGGGKNDPGRLHNNAVNALIAPMADSEHLFFDNIESVLMLPDGSLDPSVSYDKVHLAEKGYRLWLEALRPRLEQLAGKP